MTILPYLLIFVIETGAIHATPMRQDKCEAIASDVARGEPVSVRIDGAEAVLVVSAWCLKPEQEEVPL